MYHQYNMQSLSNGTRIELLLLLCLSTLQCFSQCLPTGFGVDGTRDEELSLIAGDETHVTKLTSASDIIGAMNSVKNIMESVSKTTYTFLSLLYSVPRCLFGIFF